MKYHYNKATAPREYSTGQGLATAAGDRRVIARDIPCQEACPAHTNVPRYIEQIARGDFSGAYLTNLEDNVFPGVLGRVCTHPCQDQCRHQWTNTNGPVSICHLKRAAADRTGPLAAPLSRWFGDSGHCVAVVGGGPAGLTAARELARLGHRVTLFERSNRLGGMMADGIPRFRLPLEVLDREIGYIVDMGIEVRLETPVDASLLAALIATHDAVCIAAGTSCTLTLDLPGLSPGAVQTGLDFMRRYNRGQITALHGDVVVIGGGFTAVDCSRSAARAARKLVGADAAVTIVYRRAEQSMAAHARELEELAHEQITVHTLASPIAASTSNGTIASVTFRRNTIAGGVTQGKQEIASVPGSEFTLPCTHLIVAIGQKQEWALLPKGITLLEGYATTNPRVFVAGDFATGSDNVIKAVAGGKGVARAIDTFLEGHVRCTDAVQVTPLDLDGNTGRLRDHDLLTPPLMPVLPVVERAEGDREVEMGFDNEQTRANALRCYYCHYKFEIDQDRCIHCNWCIDAAPRECIKKVKQLFFDKEGVVETVVEADLDRDATFIWIDSNQCIRCGKCLRVCPTEAISMHRAATTVCPSSNTPTDKT